MNLFLSATKNHIIHAIELIYSLRNFSNSIINVYMLIDDTDISKYQHILNDLNFKNVNIRLFPVNILDTLLSSEHNSRVLTKMAYGRIMIFKLLPELDKILYLDTDMLITSWGIDKLYELDITDKYAAVCEEISVECFDKHEMENCHVKRYFNSGLMLMNIKKLQEDHIDDTCIDMVINPPDFLKTGGMQDQSILNLAFKENVVFVNPVFNVQANLFGYPQYDKYSQTWGYKDQIDLMRHCVVSHTQGAKPWEERWNTWQAWQLPYKQWQYDYYIKIRDELMNLYPHQMEFLNEL